MKRLLILLVIVPFLGLAACKPAATPQSKELAAIDKEIADNKTKLRDPGTSSDEADRLRDRNIELDAERNNIIMKADKNRRAGGGE